jgi:hypothetical protein
LAASFNRHLAGLPSPTTAPPFRVRPPERHLGDAVAKAGNKDGSGLVGGSCIVDPNGVIVAETQTLADEVLVADLGLDLCCQGKDKMFNFGAHRRPEHYADITSRAGVIEPPLVTH